MCVYKTRILLETIATSGFYGYFLTGLHNFLEPNTCSRIFFNWLWCCYRASTDLSEPFSRLKRSDKFMILSWETQAWNSREACTHLLILLSGSYDFSLEDTTLNTIKRFLDDKKPGILSWAYHHYCCAACKTCSSESFNQTNLRDAYGQSHERKQLYLYVFAITVKEF